MELCTCPNMHQFPPIKQTPLHWLPLPERQPLPDCPSETATSPSCSSPSLCSKRCPVPARWGADIPEATASAPQEASVNNAPALLNAGTAPNSRHRQRSLNLDVHRQAAHALQVCLLVKKCENHPRANTSQKRRPVDRIGRWGGGGGTKRGHHIFPNSKGSGTAPPNRRNSSDSHGFSCSRLDLPEPLAGPGQVHGQMCRHPLSDVQRWPSV